MPIRFATLFHPRKISGIIFLTGSTVLVGWIFDISALKSVLPGFITMKVNTAIAFILSGISAFLLIDDPVAPLNNKRYKIAGLLSAGLVAAIGLFSFVEYIFNLDLGIDQLLFLDDHDLAGTSSPGRMALITAFNFMVTGSAFLVVGFPFRFKPRYWIPGLSGMFLSMLGFFGVVIYPVNTATGQGWWNYTPMALHTSVCFFLLGMLFLQYTWQGSGMRWSMKRKNTLIFSFGLLLMFFISLYSFRTTVNLVESSSWITHTQEVLKEIREVTTNILDIQSGQRGYLISGQEVYLDKYHSGVTRLYEDLEDLRKLTLNDPTRQQQLVALEPLFEDRLTLANQIITLRKEKGVEIATRLFLEGKGRELTQEIRKKLEGMEQDEYRLLELRNQGTLTVTQRTFFILPIGTFISLIVLISVFFLLNQEVTERKKAEETVRHSEQKFSILFEKAAFTAALSKPPDGILIDVNEAFERSFGYTKQEVVGKTSLELGINPDSEGRTRIVAGLQTHGSVRDLELTLQTKSGVSRIFLVNIDLVEIGGQRYILQTAQDITERKHAEEELRSVAERYRTTLDHMLEGCQIIGFDWRYLYINDVAAKQGHSTKEELFGHTMMEMYPGIENTQFFSELRRCMMEKTPKKMENEFFFPDGSKGWFHLSMEPVPEGTFILSVDITKEKQLSEELRKHRENLEELVKERTTQLEAVNKELEAFSYSVSHDLRSPLRSIDGFSQALLEDYSTKLDAQGKDYLQRVRNGSQRMADLIDDLLDLSRVTRSEIRREEVDITSMAKGIAIELQKTQPDRKVDFSIGPGLIVQADPRLLRIALENLLGNAWKFTQKKDRAKIELGSANSSSEQVFYVRDNGVGFDMTYVDRLFSAFQRLHTIAEFPGTGIGLATVQRIIYRHGGKVRAEGSVDQGAVFYFTLS